MINAGTRITGLMGWPIKHSLSPQIHNTAFHDLDLNFVYIPLAVQPQDLSQAVAGARALNFVGFNVTIPHKRAIMPYLDEIDDMAQAIGAVNTVVCRDGRLIGYNTDASGFVKALEAQGIGILGKRAVVLGAGGAARAVVCGLTWNGIEHVNIFARQENQAVALASDIGSKVTGNHWDTGNLRTAMETADLVINCTSLGMSPNIDTEPDLIWDQLNAKAVVCDIVYNPLKTKFLQQAERCGHQTVNGIGMLIQQAGLSFELWTGYTPPLTKISTMISNIL